MYNEKIKNIKNTLNFDPFVSSPIVYNVLYKRLGPLFSLMVNNMQTVPVSDFIPNVTRPESVLMHFRDAYIRNQARFQLVKGRFVKWFNAHIRSECKQNVALYAMAALWIIWLIWFRNANM